MMPNKLTNKIFFVATILASIFTLFFGIYEYRREHAFRVDILHSQLQLNNYHYLENRAEKGIRVTVIDSLGNVLYDTEVKDVRKMGNHLQREEIQEALKYGSGYAIKRATSLPRNGSLSSEGDKDMKSGEKYFYSATRFDGPESSSCPGPSPCPFLIGRGDIGRGVRGIIVRSSVPYSAELTSSLEHDYTFFYYTASILALIAIAMYLRIRYEHSEQEKQRIKRQLTENAAHELKTPAATIEGYLETLVSNPSMPEDKRLNFLERCHAQSRRMSLLLADMNTLSRLDEAKEIVNRKLADSKCIDAATILRQIQEETAMQFDEQNIQLQMKIPETLPMQGDASLIYSLFRNIFNNTLAYATNATYFQVQAKVIKRAPLPLPLPQMGGGKAIKIPTLSAKGGEVIYNFTLADNGVGVPNEHLPHIFERFYRIDKGRSRRLGGTGLGLAIVKNIALQYNGSATAYPTPKGGLTIEIELGSPSPLDLPPAPSL